MIKSDIFRIRIIRAGEATLIVILFLAFIYHMSDLYS